LAEKNIKVTVELKNDLEITGVVSAVDANLNFYLNNITVKDPEKYPQLV
jgi:U6 snRNA-associated Sm-like protein LSm2